MNIQQALKQAIREQTTISSESMSMYNQRMADLAYWLLVDFADPNYSKRLLERILDAKDWELDPLSEQQLSLFNEYIETDEDDYNGN